MCRSIKPLFNFNPPTTNEEIYEASLQFVRKISGMRKPSKINEKQFNQSVEKIRSDIDALLHSLIPVGKPHNREVETLRARERF